MGNYQTVTYISMAKCKTAVIPVRQQWSYCSLALIQRYLRSKTVPWKLGRSESVQRLSWWRHKWKQLPRYCPFMRGIHRPPVNSPYKGQWRGALMFSSICAWTTGRVNNRDAGDLRRHRAQYGHCNVELQEFGCQTGIPGWVWRAKSVRRSESVQHFWRYSVRKIWCTNSCNCPCWKYKQLVSIHGFKFMNFSIKSMLEKKFGNVAFVNLYQNFVNTEGGGWGG